jgi:type II secretory pathway component PulC
MTKLQKAQQFLSSEQGTWLALAVAMMFVLLILWEIYTGIGFLFSKPKAYTTVKGSTAFAPIQHEPRVDLSALNIFGKYQPPQVDLKDLPDSNLNLHLDGVFAAVPEYFSQAVISVPGGEQKVYFVGDTIPGDAKLYRVLDNLVIIQHNGKLSNLKLPENKLEFSPLPPMLNLPETVRQPPRSLP